MPGRLARIRASGRAKKRRLSSRRGCRCLFEGERLFGELGADRGGDVLGRKGDALGLGRGEGFMGDVLGSLDGAVLRKVARRLWPTRRMAEGSGSGAPG